MAICDEVMGHLDQMFAEIEMTIARFPDELWARKVEPDMLRIPAFLAHHTVWCMSLEHLLNIPIGRMPNNIYPDYSPENIFTRDQVLAILRDIKAHSTQTYGQMPDDEYLSKSDRPFVPLGAVMYTIAHTRHHLGQLIQLLKEHGINPPDWYPIR